jgi:hypothetical protein
MLHMHEYIQNDRLTLIDIYIYIYIYIYIIQIGSKLRTFAPPQACACAISASLAWLRLSMEYRFARSRCLLACFTCIMYVSICVRVHVMDSQGRPQPCLGLAKGVRVCACVRACVGKEMREYMTILCFCVACFCMQKKAHAALRWDERVVSTDLPNTHKSEHARTQSSTVKHAHGTLQGGKLEGGRLTYDISGDTLMSLQANIAELADRLNDPPWGKG